MSNVFQFVNELLAQVDFCIVRAIQMIACYDKTGDPDFLDLAEEFSTLADEYSSEVEKLLEFIGPIQPGVGK